MISLDVREVCHRYNDGYNDGYSYERYNNPCIIGNEIQAYALGYVEGLGNRNEMTYDDYPEFLKPQSN